MPLRRIILLSTTLAAIAALPALASDPSEGTVSPTSPTTAWSGEVQASSVGYTLYTVAGQSPSDSCDQPHCDTYTLKVEGGGNLTLTIESDTEALNEIDIALEKADGSMVVFTGSDGKAKGTIKNLPAGTYPIYVWGVVGASSGNIAFDYKASAALPAAAPAPAPGPAPAPAPDPGTGSPQPQPAPAAPATMSVKAPKASARKLNKSKRFTVKLSSSAQVKNVVLALKKGKRTVGTAKLAGFDGSGTVAVRLKKKLRAGRYALKVTATDAASGKPVATSAKVRLKR